MTDHLQSLAAQKAANATHKAKTIRPYNYWAKIVKVVDGDTVDVLVDVGFHMQAQIRIRLLGVDTPEIFGVKRNTPEYKAGVAARDYLKGIIPHGTWIELSAYAANAGGKREKYGRWLGMLHVEGVNVNELMIAWLQG